MLLRQIHNNYFKSQSDEELISKYFDEVLERVEKNFSKRNNKYYSTTNSDGVKETFFDPLHTCQWFIFIYYMSNTIYKNEKSAQAKELCDKLYCLSKMISGADLYYEVDMPEYFACDHPVGTVIGRAKYGEGFMFLQGCTVGNNKGVYPVIGKDVILCSGAKILGDCKIGDKAIISANAYVKDQDVPEGMIVYGSSPDLIFKNING